MVQRITIIGVGLIGGSIGLALMESEPSGTELVGFVRNPERGDKVLRSGAVHRVETDLLRAVHQANVVVLATPVTAVKEIMAQIGANLPSGCVVTDTASTKAKVMEWADTCLPPTVSFIGGHPMAGKELSGIEAAEPGLFRGCTYCLVPGRSAAQASIELMENLVRRIGAMPVFMAASEHDNLVAGISHLPFILSSALVTTTTRSPQWPRMSGLAATGYRDLTRLASQHPEMNRDICLTNVDNIIGWIDGFTEELNRFRRLITEGSPEEIRQAFIESRQARQRWLEDHDKRD